MASFLQSIPATELDELMSLVSEAHTGASAQPALVQQQRRKRELESIPAAAQSSLSFPLPSDLDDLTNSPTTSPRHTVQKQSLDYIAGLSQQRIEPKQSAKIQPHTDSSIVVENQESLQISATSSSTIQATEIDSTLPYCSIPAHVSAHTSDILEQFAPESSDIEGLKALDHLQQKVQSTQQELSQQREAIQMLQQSVLLHQKRDHLMDQAVQQRRDRVVQNHHYQQLDYHETREAQEAQQRLDTALSPKRRGYVKVQDPALVNRPSSAATTSVSPFLKKFQNAAARRKEQEAQRLSETIPVDQLRAEEDFKEVAGNNASWQYRDQGSAASFPVTRRTASPSSSAAARTEEHDPLAPDLINELSHDLVNLQSKYSNLEHAYRQLQTSSETLLQRERDQSLLKTQQMKKFYTEKLDKLRSQHAEALQGATGSRDREFSFYQTQNVQLTGSVQQARELLIQLMKERGNKQKRTMKEQQIFDLLCEPTFLSTTAPPNGFPSASSAAGGVTGGAASLPPFASSLVTQVPAAALPHSVVNEELDGLRIKLRQAKDEIKRLQSSENEATTCFQELVLTHKKFKNESNTKRLRMQAQLLGAVRRIKWLQEEKERLTTLNQEQTSYIQTLEGKLLTVSKRMVSHLERVEEKKQIQAQRTAMAEEKELQVERLRSLNMSPRIEEHLWAGEKGRASSPHLNGRIRSPSPSSLSHPQSPARSPSPSPRAAHSPSRSQNFMSSSVATTLAAGQIAAAAAATAPISPSRAPTLRAQALSSPEADRWIHQLEQEVAMMQGHLHYPKQQQQQHPVPVEIARRSPAPAPQTAMVLSPASKAAQQAQMRSVSANAALNIDRASSPTPTQGNNNHRQIAIHTQPSPTSTASAPISANSASSTSASSLRSPNHPSLSAPAPSVLHHSSGRSALQTSLQDLAQEVELDDTSVGSYEDEEIVVSSSEEFDEEEFERTFAASRASSSSSSAHNTSNISLKEQLAILTAKKQHADQLAQSYRSNSSTSKQQ